MNDAPTATAPRPHPGLAALACAAAVLTACFVAAPEGSWSEGVYTGGTLAALAVMAVAVRNRPDLAPWRWITLGTALSATADLVWWLAEAAEADGASWYAIDAVYFAAYAAIVRGLLLFARDRRRAAVLDRLIELWSVLVVVGLGAWLMMVEPALSADQGWPERLVALGYPVCDVALLTMTVWLFLVRGRDGEPGLGLLGVGLAGWLAADIGYLVATQIGAYEFGAQRALDSGWLIGSMLVALACVRAVTAEPGRHDRGRSPRSTGWARVATGSMLVVVPVATETLRRAITGDDPPYAVLVASVLLVGLSVARTLRLERSSERAWELLRSSERRARALAMNSSDAVLVLDEAGRLLDGQDNAQRLLDRSDPIEVGSDALGVVDPEDRLRAETVLQRCATSPGQVISTELRLVTPDGTSRWFSFRAVNLLENPDVRGLVVNVHDEHDRKQVEDELVHQAFHDALTGLANRALFHDRVRHALERSIGTRPFAVLFMDLDGFKAVNDRLGHDAGDQLLKVIARRLRDTAALHHTVARLGGDEFAVLVDGGEDAESDAKALAQQLLDALGEPVEIDGVEEVRPGASIGIALGDDDNDASSLLRNADLAMYQAKTSGRGRWVMFDRGMQAGVQERVRIERDLATALPERQLRLAYQPVVQLATQQLIGFEALLRWEHPSLGDIEPDRFIPVAESSGLIVPIGTWVLEEACRTMGRWQREFPHDPPLTMSVNVSARQLAEPDFLGVVADVLGRAGLSPERLVVEITETSLVGEADQVTSCLAGLRGMGVRLAIDDFGTGYSSLSYLRRFPVDIVKIDREFTATIDEDAPVPALLRGLLDLGRTLGLDVVAEGIETDAQFNGLLDQRCAWGQGFYFSRPLESEDAEVQLAGSFSPSSATRDRPNRAKPRTALTPAGTSREGTRSTA